MRPAPIRQLLLRLLGAVVFVAMGLLQWWAIGGALKVHLGLAPLFTDMLALVIALVPVVSTILGFLSAVFVLDWVWWQAFPLFFGALALSLWAAGLAPVLRGLLRPVD
jgi:hypothetical protein